mgnify:CR=1 FL=1
MNKEIVKQKESLVEEITDKRNHQIEPQIEKIKNLLLNQEKEI